MNHFFLKFTIPQSMIQALLPWLLADVTGGGLKWNLLDKFSAAADHPASDHLEKIFNCRQKYFYHIPVHGVLVHTSQRSVRAL